MAIRGRKPRTESVVPAGNEIDILRVEEAALSAEELGKGTMMVLAYEETILKLGRLETLNFFQTIGDVAIAEIFLSIKQSKGYVGMPYKDKIGNVRRIGTFDEFCEVKLGKSYSRCAELAQNYRRLGPALYEQSEKLGLKNGNYRALRAFPEDVFEQAKKAIEELDRETLFELFEKNQREKESLKQEALEEKKNSAAKDQVIIQTKEKINQLAEEKIRKECLTDNEQFTELLTELHTATTHAFSAALILRNRISDIQSFGKFTHESQVACSGSIQYVVTSLMRIASDFCFSLDLAGEPKWADDDPKKIANDYVANRMANPWDTNIIPGSEAHDIFDDPNAGEDPAADWQQDADRS